MSSAQDVNRSERVDAGRGGVSTVEELRAVLVWSAGGDRIWHFLSPADWRPRRSYWRLVGSALVYSRNSNAQAKDPRADARVWRLGVAMLGGAYGRSMPSQPETVQTVGRMR